MAEILETLARGLPCPSLADTSAAARAFAAAVGRDCAVALLGGLGAGKTAFVKELAKALGIARTVKSPSFNICCVYEIPAGGSLVHVDAYRLADGAQFENLLIDEIAPAPRIVCVEWAEIVKDYFEPDYILAFDIEGGAHTIKLLRDWGCA